MIENCDSETRFYLSGYRSIHNHDLKIEESGDQSFLTDRENDGMHVPENLNWLGCDFPKYCKMVGKVYSKKIDVSTQPTSKADKKRHIKEIEK